jgi:phosphoribosylformylglycinamidine (FGAM) synthase-like amidotransferase family enzyme
MSSAAQQKETQPGVMIIGTCNGKQNANAQSLVTGTHCISHDTILPT